MMRSLQVLVVLASASLAGAAVAADMPTNQAAAASGGFQLSGIKIGVNDFKRSVDFYTRYIGLLDEQELKFNASEQGLRVPGTKDSVVLVHNATGNQVLQPGGGYMTLRVPDVEKIAQKLSADGHTGFSPPREYKEYGLLILIVKDPDGNTIEMVEPLTGKP